MSGISKQQRVVDLPTLLAKTVEVGDCMVWQGWTNKRGSAYVKYMGRQTQAVRLSYLMSRGLEDSDIKGLMTWASCGDKLCINPKHICCGTRSQWRAFRHSIGADKPKPSTIAKHMVNGRKPGKCKLTMEQVREIRESNETCKEWAKRLMVHPDTVALARRGRTWAEAPTAASVFSWRPAA